MKTRYKSTVNACYLGFITLAIVNNLAPLLFVIFHDGFAISFEKIGRLIVINFGTQIVTDFLAIKYVDRIGYRKAAMLAHICSTLGLIGLGIFPFVFPSPFLGIGVAVAIYAIGGGLLEVIVSPIIESLPGDAKASAMSLLHSFYCWGQVGVVLISTALIKIFGTNIWYVLPMLWALIPLYNIFKFAKVPLEPMVSQEEKTPLRELLSSHIFIVYLILMMSAGASELTISQWSSLFAEKGLQVPKVIGDILGPALFAVLMGIGRVVYGVWGHRINLKKGLMASSVLCLLCYIVIVFVQIPIISLLGCAICGFSVALMWPGTLSLTAQSFPKGGAGMFAILAMAGDIGASIGPWMAGLVSDLAQGFNRFVALGQRMDLNSEQVGLKVGIFTAMIFPIILFLGIGLLRRKQASNNPR